MTYDYPLARQQITQTDIDTVIEALKSPQLSQGRFLEEFEQQLAEAAGTLFAVAVNSGTSALQLIVEAAGLGPGDEVITTPFSFVASTNCILALGANPVFVDINPNTYCIDVSQIEDVITDKTRAILAVDVFGNCCDWTALKELAEKHNLFLIEDSAEAIGTQYRGKRTGGLGNAGVFAFYPNKQITTGEGGAVVTDDPILYQYIKMLRNHGRVGNKFTRLGYNYRISELTAALGTSQIKKLHSRATTRISIAEMYDGWAERLNIPIQKQTDGTLTNPFVYTIEVDNPDGLKEYLDSKGIQCGRYFYPIHLMPHVWGEEGDFPITEKLWSRIISLPFFETLTSADVNYIFTHIKRFLNAETTT